jgi:hypothetical protein
MWSIPMSSSRRSVTLLTDLADFIADHRPQGTLSADATAPAWNGYLLTVACPCGVVFERWVTREDADHDLLMMARQN